MRLLQLKLTILLFIFWTELFSQAPYMLADVNKTEPDSEYGESIIFKNNLYFVGRKKSGDYFLFKTDGESTPSEVYNFGEDKITDLLQNENFLVFVKGNELWKSDGSFQGTEKALELPYTLVNGMGFQNDRILFTMNLGSGYQSINRIDLNSNDTLRLKSKQNLKSVRTVGELDGKTFFVGYFGEFGYEIFYNPEDSDSLLLLKDINPGIENGLDANTQVAKYNNKIFFIGKNPEFGNELWLSDGTEAGTNMVIDLFPGSGSYSNIGAQMYSAESGLVFRVGNSIYRSDGTPQGTRSLTSIGVPINEWRKAGGRIFINTGYNSNSYVYISSGIDIAAKSMGNRISEITFFENKYIYSSKNESPKGSELFKFENGTVSMLKNINEEPDGRSSYSQNSSFPRQFREINGNLLFLANDGINGTELWKIKNDSTYLFYDLNKDFEATPSSEPSDFFEFNNHIYFQAFEKGVLVKSLYRRESAGNEVIKVFETANPIDQVVLLNERIYISAPGESLISDAEGLTFTSMQRNVKLYSASNVAMDSIFSTGNKISKISSNLLITDFSPYEVDNEVISGSKFIVNAEGNYFVAAGTSKYGTELYKLNLRTNSVDIVKDISVGPASSKIVDMKAFNGNILFLVELDYYSMELWFSDGTELGTRRIGTYSYSYPSSPPISLENNAILGDYFYYSANSPNYGFELFRTDGTIENTYLVKDIASGYCSNSTPNNFFENNGDLFFVARENCDFKLFKINRGKPDSLLVLSKRPYNSFQYLPWNIGKIEKLDSRNIIFTASDGGENESGYEMWLSDGTQSGTKLYYDLRGGPGNSSPSDYFRSKNEVYFSANANSKGFEPWVLTLPNCEDELIIRSNITSSLVSNSNYSTIIDGKLIDNSHSEVSLVSNGSILLNPGFETRTFRTFKATISPCPN